MNRAITSLPVPDSPCSETVVSVAATCIARFRTPFHSTDCPIAGTVTRPPIHFCRERLHAAVEPLRPHARFGVVALGFRQLLVRHGQRDVVGKPTRGGRIGRH